MTAHPLFTLEALQAKNGDCLLLHYGRTEKPRFILIDGGPRGVFKNTLKHRLDALREKFSPGGALPIELLVVSHIDDDHIQGIIELFQFLLPTFQAGAKPPYRIKALWHNSFADLVGKRADGLLTNWARERDRLGAELRKPVGAAMKDLARLQFRTVEQGRSLRQLAKQLEIGLNRGFRSLVSASDGVPKLRARRDGLKLAVLGPGKSRLEKLFEEWRKYLESRAAPLLRGAEALHELTDDSVANLSSIILLAEMEGLRMLLPGDARADDILAGLKAGGHLGQGRAHVNLLKLPHHGSSRNVNLDFFRSVTADHYVISGNGADGNPEPETLLMIAEARRPETCTFHFTNDEGRQNLGTNLKNFFAGEKARGFEHKACFPEPNAFSLKVDLLAPATY